MNRLQLIDKKEVNLVKKFVSHFFDEKVSTLHCHGKFKIKYIRKYRKIIIKDTYKEYSFYQFTIIFEGYIYDGWGNKYSHDDFYAQQPLIREALLMLLRSEFEPDISLYLKLFGIEYTAYPELRIKLEKIK